MVLIHEFGPPNSSAWMKELIPTEQLDSIVAKPSQSHTAQPQASVVRMTYSEILALDCGKQEGRDVLQDVGGVGRHKGQTSPAVSQQVHVRGPWMSSPSLSLARWPATQCSNTPSLALPASLPASWEETDCAIRICLSGLFAYEMSVQSAQQVLFLASRHRE